MGTPSVANRRARLSGRQAAIELDVKRMVARELHDRVAQTLTGMIVDLENFKSQQVGWDDVLKELNLFQSSTKQVLVSLRDLLHELRGEQGSIDFAKNLDDLITRFEAKTGIGVVLEVEDGWPAALAPAASLNLARIIDEALTNVRMHSGAQTVRIVLGPNSEDELMILVVDDGRGIDPEEKRLAGLGTIGMKERAMLVGGRLTIESNGSGTEVRAVFPKDVMVPEEDPWQPQQLLLAEPVTV